MASHWITAGFMTFAKLITVEPAIFLQSFNWGLQSVISQNMMIAKVCRDFGYNQTICANIDNHTMEENMVQVGVTSLNMNLQMLTALPSIFLGLFVGAWSDRNGRKPVILGPMLGYILSNLVWLVNIYYWEAPAKYLLASGVYSFFGGFTCFLVGVYSFLADITSVEMRTTRIGLLDLFMFSGVPAGTFISAYIFQYAGYYGIFITSTLIQTISFLYIAALITDTRGPSSPYCHPDSELEPNPQPSALKRYLSIFDWHQLAEVCRATIKRRENNLRHVVLLLIFLMLLNVTIFSEGSLTYLYARKKFLWNEQQFTRFTTCVTIVSGVSIFLVMPVLSLYLKVHDATIGVLATISKITSLVIISLAPNGWVLFVGACSGFLSTLSAIVIRSILSKVVVKSELGKIFSMVASLEAAVPLFAAPIFTFVYNHTLDSFPGAVFLVQVWIALSSIFIQQQTRMMYLDSIQASLFVLSCFIFIYIYFVLSNPANASVNLLVEDEEDYQVYLECNGHVNDDNREIVIMTVIFVKLFETIKKNNGFDYPLWSGKHSEGRE